jgi:hypothetical protein
LQNELEFAIVETNESNKFQGKLEVLSKYYCKVKVTKRINSKSSGLTRDTNNQILS